MHPVYEGKQSKKHKMKNTQTVIAGERTQIEEREFQVIKHSHQGDATWARYQELAVKRSPSPEEIEAPGTVKFLKKGIKSGGKYFPCWYSLATLLNGKTAITIYAKSLLTGLPAELNPQNDSDMQTDYFEKDKVRFYEGSFTFELLKPFTAR